MEQKKSKVIIISIVVALVLIVGTIATVSVVSRSSNEPTKVASQKLSLGQKFLLDLDYEKAVAEFNAVIEIEPRNVDAYIGLADAYIGLGDEEKAIEALEKGYEATGDETIKAKLDELKKPEEITVETTVETTAVNDNRVYNEDGTYSKYEYNDNGTMKKETVYDTHDSIIEVSEYNEDGILIKYINYINKYYAMCEHDENGNILKISYYSLDDILQAENEFDYNSGEAKLIRRTEYIYEYTNDGNEKALYFFWVYEYDGKERCLGGTAYYGDKYNLFYNYGNNYGDQVGKYKVEYYDNGKMKLKRTDLWIYRPSSATIVEYNEQGRKIKSSTYQPSLDGSLGEPLFEETY